ncbi:lasso peptide biosynthesis B2 protein [Anaerobacillus sp. CMMVII]|uniref:lasso peptide biosynthesis B2 protein n=1 Tax=Anaerobacillus sp. CMMVII TaxID=2755588 RepID=UPI0021B7B7F6|nr:lasso peptide biosynthesis B2 protein [Anaerobacillus sp. CMMVII]MCT8138138.1 lasso peptide biosynthesis B2 protein [Anaerobacillus sp. CMMVII]
MVNKLKVFFKLDRKTKLLLVEAYLYLGWARILKVLPFAKVAPSLGIQMEETSLTLKNANKETLRSVSHAIHVMSKYTFWESQCLVKAIAAMRMLEKRGVESTLYLGTAKDTKGILIAHAWLRSGPFYVSGFEGMENFTVVSKFAKKMTESQTKGVNDNG